MTKIGKSKAKILGVEALKITFATPAALGVISKVDERINLDQILEKIILSYDKVLRKITLNLQDYLNIPQNFSEIMIFLIFLFSSFYISKRLQLETAGNSEKFWGYISAASCILFLFTFSVADSFAYYLWMIILFGTYFVVSTLLFFLCAYVFGKFPIHLNFPKNQLLGRDAGIFLLFLLAYIFISIFALGLLNELNLVSKIDVSHYFLSLILFMSWIFLFIDSFTKNRRGPAYVLLWALGFLIVNWLATVVFPTLDLWLNDLP